jgi:hypothetical protein
MPRLHRAHLIAGALVLLLAPTLSVRAAVLCQRKSGVVVVRPTACKKKEVPLDLTQFGAVGPAGPAGRDFTVDATLPSGATQVGVFTGSLSLNAAPSGAQEVQIPIALRIPLAAPIPEANAIRVTGVDGTALHCPGLNRADPGYFCLYETYNYGAATFIEFDNNDEGLGGISRYGTSLLYNGISRRSVISGTWAVTAP